MDDSPPTARSAVRHPSSVLCNPLAQQVAAAVRGAGALAREAFGKPIKTWLKGTSPVSEIDIAVNVLLKQQLAAIAPDAGWLSEETEDAPARLTAPRVWIVDPIDGTRGFARKNGEFSVMVALVDQGRIAVGVVDEPAKERITYATHGGGCF